MMPAFMFPLGWGKVIPAGEKTLEVIDHIALAMIHGPSPAPGVHGRKT